MKAVSEVNNGVSTNLLFFDNRRSFEDFANNYPSNIYDAARLQSIEVRTNNQYNDPHRFGYPTANSPLEVRQHSKFLGIDLYREQKQKIRSLLSKAESLGKMQEIPNRKLKFNDLGLGVFCFPRAAVGLRKHKKQDGTIKIVSDVRDVYAYFPQNEDSKFTIVLYQLVNHSSSVSGSQMLYNGIVSMAISEYLVESGYDVEINIVYNTSNSGSGKKISGVCVKAKSVTEELVVNDLMLMASDPRHHRYVFFKAAAKATSYFFKEKVDLSGGWIVEENVIFKFLEKQRSDALPIMVKPCYSEKAVMEEVNRVLKIVKNS